MKLGEWQMAGNPRTESCENAERPLAIEARGLVKLFDGFTAVDGVDITVPKGAIYGILGPNGAGKTTTLRMLLGIIDPDAGTRREWRQKALDAPFEATGRALNPVHPRAAIDSMVS